MRLPFAPSTERNESPRPAESVSTHNLTLERIERQIRNLPVEHVYVLGADNEILFHHTDDLPDRVRFPGLLLGDLSSAIVTHNHPGGRSFSRIDVGVAIGKRLRELRVVTPSHRYSLRRSSAAFSVVSLPAALRLRRSA
jgi:hypothetical protein